MEVERVGAYQLCITWLPLCNYGLFSSHKTAGIDDLSRSLCISSARDTVFTRRFVMSWRTPVDALQIPIRWSFSCLAGNCTHHPALPLCCFFLSSKPLFQSPTSWKIDRSQCLWPFGQLFLLPEWFFLAPFPSKFVVWKVKSANCPRTVNSPQAGQSQRPGWRRRWRCVWDEEMALPGRIDALFSSESDGACCVKEGLALC